jgi:hypothetical protein
VIYVRVSTKEQTENLSLLTQLRACEEYCRRQGYEILERFQRGRRGAKSDRSQPVSESVPQIWKARKAAVREEIANAERAAKAIQDKLDRLDEAFPFWGSQNAFCRAPLTCGCRRHSTSVNGSNNCSFPKELRSTETALFEVGRT